MIKGTIDLGVIPPDDEDASLLMMNVRSPNQLEVTVTFQEDEVQEFMTQLEKMHALMKKLDLEHDEKA